MSSLDRLLSEIRQCTACRESLPHPPRPVLVAQQDARILIMGQAPGLRVHQSGIAWDDPSGQRLRQWMNVDRETFYDASKVALVPMGFCYPGTGSQGDLPPRKECAEIWHERLLAKLEQVQLTLVIGRYAQQYRLGENNKATLTETVQCWSEFAPELIPLPHPSPRNNRWLKRNPFFERDVVPYLADRIQDLL
ncbi:MAG: uracil-DNA glycosylase family protein [Planctomycetota bacterium]